MTFREFWQSLTEVYPEQEARWIGRFVFEVRYGLSQADLLMGRETDIAEEELRELQRRLLTGEPVQYVISQAPFGDHLFSVTPAVLIPRPETLWLCRAVSNHLQTHGGNILDIGTGSGCIAITIALATAEHGMTPSFIATDEHGMTRNNYIRESPCSSDAKAEDRESPCSSVAKISAWDISAEALAVARANAERLQADVTFEQHDILTPPDDTARWDTIVSNPPYICEQEKTTMERNVLNYEPLLALFVPDDDPLLFYRAIARYAIKALRPGGHLFLEINPLYARPLCNMLLAQGFAEAHICQDDYGKDRYIVASV